MRVLFCLQGPNEINGPNVWLIRHLPLLAQHGITPRVLYLAEDPERPCRFLEALQSQGIGATKVTLTRFTDDNVPAILNGVAVERPDLFVPNYTAAAYYACRYVREAGIGTIGTLHSDDPYYHDILDTFVREPEGLPLSGVVTVSDYLYALAGEAVGPDTRVCDATYGAPLPASIAAGQDDGLRLLYVGRLVERQKRVRRVTERLCAAAAAIDGVTGVLYGEGAEGESVRAIVEAHGDGRVTLGGALSPEAMQPAMLQGQALVLLSDFEGLSIALMEAMACGLVPIVSDIRSGIGDLIRHGENGLIVDPDSEADFLQAVRRLRFEPGLRARLGAAARETIVAKGYTSEECARRWATFCRDLQPASPPPPMQSFTAADIKLPLPCTRPFGLRIGDRRDPHVRIAAILEDRRPIFVWGASTGGRQFLATATGRQTPIAGIVDRRAGQGMPTFQGLTAYPPAVLQDRVRDPEKPFVVIASMYEEEISDQLTGYGFVQCEDFVTV